MATISKETAKTLADTIGMVKFVGEANAKIQPQYKKMFEGLKKAVADASADDIELYQPQLKKVVEAIDKCQHSVQGALALLAQLRKDDALMETKFDQVKKLTEQMSGIRKQLVDEAAAARKIDADAGKADEAAKKDSQSAEADLDALKDEAAEIKKKVDVAKRDMPKLGDEARKANEKNDKKALTAARMKILDFQELDLPAKALRLKLEKYKKQYPDIDKGMKADLVWMYDNVQDAIDTADDADKLVKELLALKPLQKEEKAVNRAPFAKADVLKAAAVLGIEAKDEPKLAKLLNETPRFKWADALGKLGTQLKLKDHDGKAMLVKLNKLSFIQKGQLIDI
jgi:chromosome segregation ATPase